MNHATAITTETATLGNGCFWCTEAIFQQVNGVISVRSGYCGGHTLNPDYKSVCSGITGHAECLQIVYDANKIRFDEILEIFWKTHDPTTLNRQGNDIGTQYRSVVFYHNEDQKNIAEAYIRQLTESKTYNAPIVSSIEPMTIFYPAEDYHQQYYNRNGGEPYCAMVVRPKVEKFKNEFKNRLKNDH